MAEGKRGRGLRRIDGKTFGLATRPMKKEDAKKSAEMVRRQGRLARVLPNKDGNYEVYISNTGKKTDVRKVDRTFYSTPAGINALISTYGINPTITNNNKKPSFISRLFGGKKSSSGNNRITRKEEYDIQQVNDYKNILKKIEASPDLVDLPKDEMRKRAEVLSLSLRQQKEQDDRNLVEAERLEREARSNKDVLANLAWDQEVQTYNESYGVGQVLKYNSLEIASTGTGALTGWGIAALMGSAAFPIVPIGAGVGYLTAKAARPNLFGLGTATKAVLNTVDYVEKDLITDSIRVSGGFEKDRNLDGTYKLDARGRKITTYPSRNASLTRNTPTIPLSLRVPKRTKPEDVLGLSKTQTKRIKTDAKRRRKNKS